MSHEDKRNKGREKWHAQSTKRPSLTYLLPLPTSERGSCHLAILGELEQENERANLCDKQPSREYVEKDRKGEREWEGEGAYRLQWNAQPGRLHNLPL